MKIFITSIGTRGDIEPFLALGEILVKHGHTIIYCFPVQFKTYIPKNSLFFPLTQKFLELINTKEGHAFMGKSPLVRKASALFSLYRKGKDINNIIVKEHLKALSQVKPELMIIHPKCAMPIIWSLEHNIKLMTYSPVPFVLHPVDYHPHIGFPFFRHKLYIKWSYKLGKIALVKQVCDAQKRHSSRFNFSKKEIKSKILKQKYAYAVSPNLFQRSINWLSHIQVLGHHERDSSLEYKPAKELLDFLQKHDKILFLTFGSMVNGNPTETSKCIYSVIRQLNIPCIVNTSAGGLVELKDYTSLETFYFIENIPYKYLFSKLYAVIHHGGSGTTHMGLCFGLPTLIIPHIMDQFMWNRIIHEKDLGPKGISINKLNHNNLKPLIKSLYYDKSFKNSALKLSQEMHKEDLEDEIVDFIIN